MLKGVDADRPSPTLIGHTLGPSPSAVTVIHSILDSPFLNRAASSNTVSVIGSDGALEAGLATLSLPWNLVFLGNKSIPLTGCLMLSSF